MSLQWIEVYLWPDCYMVHFFAPDGFKAKFTTTRVIVDGTECLIKKPSSLFTHNTHASCFNEFVILGDGVFAIYC